MTVALAAMLMVSNIVRAATEEPLSFTDARRFGAYGDNYGLFNIMNNTDWAGRDDWAVRAHYSFGYLFFVKNAWDVVGTYTGEFDFYIPRTSKPVINRLSNPALHLRWHSGEDVEANPKVNWPTGQGKVQIDLGVEHESDGQAVEVTTDVERAAAQTAYDEKDYRFFDYVSRGANFVSLTADWPQGFQAGRLTLPFALTLSVRKYWWQDYAITWGPLAERKKNTLSDYHIGSIEWRRYQGNAGMFDVKWTLGMRGLATDSWDFSWCARNDAAMSLSIPLYVRLHIGPNNTLSNYSQRQDSIGVGLQFSSR